MSREAGVTLPDYVDETDAQVRLRLARQFWGDTEAVSPFVTADRIKQRYLDYLESRDIMPADRLGLPIVSGVLIDDPRTKLSEQAISVEKLEDGHDVSIHVIDPDWASVAYGKYALEQYVVDYRTRQMGVPFAITRTYSLGRNDPAFSSLDQGNRPVISFSYGLSGQRRGAAIDFSEARVVPSVVKPILKTSFDNPAEALDDARIAITQTGRELRAILQAGRQIGGSTSEQMHALSAQANVVAALWAQQEGISLIYANHMRGSSSTTLSTRPEGHYLVGGNLNAPVTAPYRTPAAYFNQRIIAHALSGGQALYDDGELEAIADFLQTGNHALLTQLRPEVMWEAKAVRALFKRAPIVQAMAELFNTLPASLAEIPIRRYFIERLKHSRKNFDILAAVNDAEVKEEKYYTSRHPIKPHECMLRVDHGGRSHQTIGFGENPENARSDAAFSVLMSMTMNYDIEAHWRTVFLKHYLRTPAYARAILDWLRNGGGDS